MKVTARLTSPVLASNKWATLIVLAVADLMVVLDTSVVFVALPSIQRALDFSSMSSLQWVVNAYVLAFGGFLLLGGRFADRFGRRRVFISGVVGFVVASLACGLAGSQGMLIAARAVQGLAAAFMTPAALSLVTVIFVEGRERDRALGVWGAIASSGAAIGLVAGGGLVSWLSWRWAFFINVPIGAFAAIAALGLIGETRERVGGGFDVVGAVSVTGGLALLVFGLVSANQWGWGSATTIGVLLAAALLIGVFVIVQVRRAHPLVPPRLFHNQNMVGADVDMLLVGAGAFAMFFFLTLYMQEVLHYSAVRTGAGFLAVTATSITSATLGSRLLSRAGARRILVTGFLMVATGLGLLVRISPTTGYLDILPSLVLIGAGNGAAFVSMMSLAMAGVPGEDTGIASGLLNASQQVGGSLGIAILTAVAAARFNAVRPPHPTVATLAAATTSSWKWAFAVAAVFVVGAVITSGLLIRAGREPPLNAEKVAPVQPAALGGPTATEPVATRPTRPARELVPLLPPCHGSALPVLTTLRHPKSGAGPGS
jgi:EmrB/QacA subfamily drug resistance transporter